MKRERFVIFRKLMMFLCIGSLTGCYYLVGVDPTLKKTDPINFDSILFLIICSLVCVSFVLANLKKYRKKQFEDNKKFSFFGFIITCFFSALIVFPLAGLFSFIFTYSWFGNAFYALFSWGLEMPGGIGGILFFIFFFSLGFAPGWYGLGGLIFAYGFQDIEILYCIALPSAIGDVIGEYLYFALEEDKISYWKKEELRLSLEQTKEMVEIPGKSFSVGKYQVTQALWESVMGNNPSRFKGSSRPVENVSWFDCVLFCNKLSEKEGLEKVYTLPDDLEQVLKKQKSWTYKSRYELSYRISQNLESNGYRLPTEWEWWFAAKANDDFEYSGSDNVDEVAWYRENSMWETQGVGKKRANGFGLYDMSGNVKEWCWDWYGDDDPIEDSTGPSTGDTRVYRGGSWGADFRDRLAISRRDNAVPSAAVDTLGFRLSRTILPDSAPRNPAFEEPLAPESLKP